MATESQRPKGRDGALSSLDKAINDLNRANDAMGAIPAKAVFASAGVLLTTIRVSFLPVRVGRLLNNVYRTQRFPKRIMSN
jgi:hypothetical protein